MLTSNLFTGPKYGPHQSTQFGCFDRIASALTTQRIGTSSDTRCLTMRQPPPRFNRSRDCSTPNARPRADAERASRVKDEFVAMVSAGGT